MRKLILALVLIPILFQSCKSRESSNTKSIDHISVALLSKSEMRAMKTHLNEAHLSEAHKSKIKTPIKSKAYFKDNLDHYCKHADLEKITTNPLYAVGRLTYSLPYLNEKSVDFLALLGERMEKSFEEKGIKHYRFVLTSVLRTLKDQRQLQRVNANATPNETSHYYGTTFDISQTRFLMSKTGESVYSYRLRNLLARELIKLQEEGECYVIIESREKCFHVTVRQ